MTAGSSIYKIYILCLFIHKMHYATRKAIIEKKIKKKELCSVACFADYTCYNKLQDPERNEESKKLYALLSCETLSIIDL